MKIVQGDTSNSLPIPKIFEEVESEGTPYNPIQYSRDGKDILMPPKTLSRARKWWWSVVSIGYWNPQCLRLETEYTTSFQPHRQTIAQSSSESRHTYNRESELRQCIKSYFTHSSERFPSLQTSLLTIPYR